MPDLVTASLLVFASTLAGFIDAIAGGGGLILLPALLLGLPATTPIPTILGTNKVAACSGTTVALWQYAHAELVPRRELILPFGAAVLGASLGVHFAYQLPTEAMRPVLLVLLVLVLGFVLLRPELGKVHAPKLAPGARRLLTGIIALGLGFYDGVFGPGTGSLLIFLFVSVLGYDFLRASALAKAANWGSNIASVVLFVAHGSVIPALALLLAAGNILGARLGVRLAITRGNRLVRALFLTAAFGLVLRLAWQMWRG
ncbi:MAG: TSUP family transporter [Deltaproteobacteria bacterium]|nr:TSUP family transporter [Deltaproteobacteria bacterium]